MGGLIQVSLQPGARVKAQNMLFEFSHPPMRASTLRENLRQLRIKEKHMKKWKINGYLYPYPA